MDTGKGDRKKTQAELLYAYEVFEEWEKTGTTDRRCPWCGGSSLFFLAGNSYEIRCERDGCFKLTSRGL